jgi:hypothetical protein
MDANGFPNQTPTSSISINPSNPAGYYGTLTWSWSGTAALKDNSGLPAIFTSISPQGAIYEMGNVSSGDHAPSTYNITCAVGASCGGGGAGTTVANPSIVFQYGWNIQSISNNGSGLIRINTKTNYVASSCWGNTGTADNGNVGPLINISGAVANTGANGTWAVTNCLASSFDLVGSTFTSAQVSAQGTGTFAGTNLSIQMLAQGTWSGFTNLVYARTGDIAAIGAGHIADAAYVNQLKTLMNPNGTCVANKSCGWLRFMDVAQGQANQERDYANRITPAAMSYLAIPYWRPAYWSGNITNTADALTASDPSTSVWSGSSYIDGAIVEGVVSATNAGAKPTLNVGGHGAKPIVWWNQTLPAIVVILSGPPTTPGTDTMSFTFSAGAASWFNSGANCSGTYTTQASDTSIAALAGNLDVWFGGGIVGGNSAFTCLTNSGVFHGNPNGFLGPMIYQPSAQAGHLTATYTAGPAIATVGTIQPSTIPSGTSNPTTFIYSYLLDAWIWGTTVDPSAPIEYAIDLANQVGANLWWTFGTNSSGYVQSTTQAVANASTGLTAGLRFGFEAGNEVWNCFGPEPCPYWKTLGNALGISSSGNASVFNFTGLRTAQYGSVAKTAWSGQGRAASDFYTFLMAQADGENVNGNFDTNQLKGASLNNTWVASYGALGGGATAINYTTTGNRPIDASPVGIGLAPYWGSRWLGATTGNIIGTVAGNAPWLQAQLDFANGLTTLAFTEMANTFNGVTARTDGQNNFTISIGDYGGMYTNMEAVAAQYDSYRVGAALKKVARFDYEGGPQWAFSSNGVNGTNSATDAGSISALTTQITNLGWNVSAYTKSGTNTISELVTQILTFGQAWKVDSSYANIIQTYLYQNEVAISGGHRETHGAQYGYNADTWGLYPGDFTYNNPYKNFNAIANQNAGN